MSDVRVTCTVAAYRGEEDAELPADLLDLGSLIQGVDAFGSVRVVIPASGDVTVDLSTVASGIGGDMRLVLIALNSTAPVSFGSPSGDVAAARSVLLCNRESGLGSLDAACTLHNWSSTDEATVDILVAAVEVPSSW